MCGKLTLQAAEEFGLLPGTPVAASLIDAHAGSLGVVGCIAENISPQFHKRLGNTNIFTKKFHFSQFFI